MVEQENKLYQRINSNSKAIQNQSIEQKKLPSLIILETLINLVNKRSNIQFEFRQLDGYILLQRIFTSIASLNKYLLISGDKTEILNYYAQIQNDLFVILLNGCFHKPVICMNYYCTNFENIELCFNVNTVKQTEPETEKFNLRKLASDDLLKSSIHVINPDLLSQVIIEWELWIPFKSLLKSDKNDNRNVYKFMFQILNKLLENENKSQMYHSNIFLKYNLLEKLMNFMLDANAENYLVDQATCLSLINIFKHFNSVYTSNPTNNQHYQQTNSSTMNITKQLFSSFFDYLYILHPENNVYIVNQKNEFYFNLNQSIGFLF